MRKISQLLLCLLASSVLAACGKQGEQMPSHSDMRARASGGAVDSSPVPQGDSGLIPNMPGVSTIDMAKLAMFKPARSMCAVDKVTGKDGGATTEFSSSDDIRLVGWVLTPKLGSPQRFAILLLSEQHAYAIPGAAGGERPDVAKVFKSDAAAHSGYGVSANLGTVEPGAYSISLLQDSGGTVSMCTTKRRINVRR